MTRTVEIEVEDLEWEVVDKALSAPIRDYLLAGVKEMFGDRPPTDEQIDEAWSSVIEKWQGSW